MLWRVDQLLLEMIVTFWITLILLAVSLNFQHHLQKIIQKTCEIKLSKQKSKDCAWLYTWSRFLSLLKMTPTITKGNLRQIFSPQIDLLIALFSTSNRAQIKVISSNNFLSLYLSQSLFLRSFQLLFRLHLFIVSSFICLFIPWMQFAHPRLSIGQNNQAWENTVFFNSWTWLQIGRMTMLNPQLKMIQQQNAFLIYNLHCSFILGDGEKTCTSSYPQVLLQITLCQKSRFCPKY